MANISIYITIKTKYNQNLNQNLRNSFKTLMQNS